MVEMRNCGYSAVQDVLGGTVLAQFNNFGVDEQGPVPHLQTNNNVQVPENGFQPSERSLQETQHVLSYLDGMQDPDGILAYQLVLQILQTTQN